MLTIALLALVTTVFPRAGQRLPAVSQCYAIGHTDGGESEITVQGRKVAVEEGGGWVTMLEVKPGANSVDVAGTRLEFTVAQPKPVLQSVVDKLPAKTYSKLEYAADVPKVHPRGRAPGSILIVLDAGHGGEDAGTLSPHARPEKEVNLLMTDAVAEELRARGFRVALTRELDVPVSLYDRPRVAHRLGADAFVSIHHNAPPCDRDPRRFRYHAVYAWNDIGRELAGAVNRRMADAFGADLKNNGVCSANYAVTRNPEIPSCLVEVDFITSPQGEEDCWDSERRGRVAAAIAQGIADWSGAVAK